MIKVIGELQSSLHKVVVCDSCKLVLSYHPLDVKHRRLDCRVNETLKFIQCIGCGNGIMLSDIIRHD